MDKKKILIFGDSYSTFEGYVPEGFAVHYPAFAAQHDGSVSDVSHTWWHMAAAETGAEIILNNSWSGSTICNTGYHGDCSATSSFICRLNTLIEDGFFKANKLDGVWVFGGTNDSSTGNACGQLIYSDWTTDDLRLILPGISYFFYRLQSVVPSDRIHAIINCDLREEVTDGMTAICEHYGITYTKLYAIDKIAWHPTSLGMRQIKEQVLKALI